jgi:hypothetical protein
MSALRLPSHRATIDAYAPAARSHGHRTRGQNKEHQHRITREWLVGGADFVAEVGSEDSLTRDRRDKYLEFQATGMREYLWFEGREGHTGFDFYRLDAAGIYQPVQPDDLGRYHSKVLPGFWFDPRWFEQDPLANPLHLLKTIAPDAWRRFVADEPLA